MHEPSHPSILTLCRLEFMALAASQLVGGFVGGVLVWLHFLPHFKTIPEPPSKSDDELLLRRSGRARWAQCICWCIGRLRGMWVKHMRDVLAWLQLSYRPDPSRSGTHMTSRSGSKTVPPSRAAQYLLSTAFHSTLPIAQPRCSAPRGTERGLVQQPW